MNRFVTISEFQRVSGLPDEVLLGLIRENLLPCRYDPEQGLEVDLESTDLAVIADRLSRRAAEVLDEDAALFEERAATIISERLDRIISEAVETLARHKGDDGEAA